MSETTEFWTGKFGDDYAARSPGDPISNVSLFNTILQRTYGVQSVLELGAGTGMNLRAIKMLLPNAVRFAVEVNASAFELLQREMDKGEMDCAMRMGIEDFHPTPDQFDLVFTKGVLIHIPPADLPSVYAKMVSASRRYVLIAEYFNSSPVEIEYRGHAGRLWKRDFAADMIAQFPSLRVIDYGFVWKHDSTFPQDDLTWFLMEKRDAAREGK